MTDIARRSFLATIGAGLAAPAILRAQSRSKRYPIAFSTLGCPAWSWKTILENADRLGYAGIELRGVAGEMDLPKVPELSGTNLAGTKKDLAALGIVVSDLGASSRMHEKDPATREQQFDEGRRFIALVDEFYDRAAKLVLSAAAAPDALYRGERLRFEFERTRSRLAEMQSHEYLARPHRP